MRRLERLGDSVPSFRDKCLQAVRAYPTPELLVPSMHKRMRALCALRGGVVTNAKED